MHNINIVANDIVSLLIGFPSLRYLSLSGHCDDDERRNLGRIFDSMKSHPTLQAFDIHIDCHSFILNTHADGFTYSCREPRYCRTCRDVDKVKFDTSNRVYWPETEVVRDYQESSNYPFLPTLFDEAGIGEPEYTDEEAWAIEIQTIRSRLETGTIEDFESDSDIGYEGHDQRNVNED